MKVAIIGQGYVGLPLAISAAESGHLIVGIDSNPALVSTISSGASPISDIEHTRVKRVIASGRYRVTTAIDAMSQAEIIVICVPTPLGSDRQPDYSYVESALESIAQMMTPHALVITESTVSPGINRGLIKEALDKVAVPYELAYSPERIDPGNKRWNVTNTPKLVAGLTPAATERAAAFYRTFVETVTTGSSLEVVETAKLLENSFRLINISFINEIAQLCAAMGIDVREVVDAAATKPYGFMPFYPGAGVGGHCIPVDPAYLAAKAQEVGSSARFIELANDVNRSLASYFTGVALGILGELKGKKILVIGLAYKPDVADVRETPAEGLIHELRSRGADVEWHDELVVEWNREKSVSLSPHFDLAILVNPHSDTNLSALGSTRILNTRGGY